LAKICLFLNGTHAVGLNLKLSNSTFLQKQSTKANKPSRCRCFYWRLFILFFNKNLHQKHKLNKLWNVSNSEN